MKIAILGAGALGSVIGAELHTAGHDVVLLDLNEAHLSAIRAEGLRVDWDDRTDYLKIPAMRPDQAPQVDLVILLTKTMHTDAALQGIAPLIDAGACVMTLQNGLGNVERLRARVPDGQVLFGCTMTPGDLRGPGHVASHGMAYTPFDALDANGAAAELAAELDGVQLTWTEAAAAQVWKKAAFNCARTATAVLGAGTVGAIAEYVGAGLARDIAAEVLAVGAAEGVTGDIAAVEQQIDFALREHTGHKPSMLQDVEAGRRTEIEALNGYVERIGETRGIAVPMNRLLAALVRMREAQG
ncbi:ketopantoate reductase family protein [Phaeobacter sp. HF9A]|uniref:ketopantoate reductase family protein n=1 Tax=Phaeobacter sp. HF9A TaxID=2721561 RepID=UPI0014315469|nr:ketopantoate reductase family protein [Phaeobacter sp. HF9A]NIZ12279.1 ketopantoate reductase family protein [Phaeobacter sp. HF9A]